MPILLSIKPSTKKTKKWNALFRMPDNKFKTVSFGDPKSEDYLKHNDLKRRELYLKRHEKDLKTNNPLKPGYLAYYITWSGFEQKTRPTRSIPKLIKLFNAKFFKE